MLTIKALIMIATSTTALVGGGVVAIVYSFSGLAKTTDALKLEKTALEPARDTAAQEITALTDAIARYDLAINTNKQRLSTLSNKLTTTTANLSTAEAAATTAAWQAAKNEMQRLIEEKQNKADAYDRAVIVNARAAATKKQADQAVTAG